MRRQRPRLRLDMRLFLDFSEGGCMLRRSRRAKLKLLRDAGRFVRREAQDLMPTCDSVSDPGDPPHAHTRAVK